jgi:hypothetical protein
MYQVCHGEKDLRGLEPRVAALPPSIREQNRKMAALYPRFLSVEALQVGGIQRSGELLHGGFLFTSSHTGSISK